MTQPHVDFSVVIPLYNMRGLVRRAVESALQQTYRCREVIVVDDGSTDGSALDLSALAGDCLRVIRQENAGEGAARNTGMRHAKGEWIAFLDADDMWLPHHLEELARVIRSFPDAALVSGATLQRPSAPDTASASSTNVRARVRRVDYFLEAARDIGFINSSSTAIRRSASLQVGDFSTFRAGTDLEYWARVALRFPVAISEEVTSIYIRNTNGTMAQVSRSNDQSPHIETLTDVSPSVAMLYRANETDPSIFGRTNVIRYVNSRVFNSVKSALYRRNVIAARQRCKLFISPLDRRAQLLRSTVALPVPVVLASIDGYSALRHGGRIMARSRQIGI